MKKIICAISLLFITLLSFAQGKVLESLSVKSKVLGKLGDSASSVASSIKSGASTALSAAKPKNLYNFGERRADDAKAFAPKLYSFIYSVAITALAFLIFMPALGFLFVGIICDSLLKGKIGYIKRL